MLINAPRWEGAPAPEQAPLASLAPRPLVRGTFFPQASLLWSFLCPCPFGSLILKILKSVLPSVVSETPFAVFRFTSKPFCHSRNIFSSSQVLQAVLKIPGSSLASSCSKYSVSAPLNSEGICLALYRVLLGPPPVEEYLFRDYRDGAASSATPPPSYEI